MNERAGKSRDAGDRLEPHERVHAAPGVRAGVRVAGHLVTEALGGDVHRRPQAVVVVRDHLVGREVAGDPQARVGGEAPAVVARLHALDEDPDFSASVIGTYAIRE